MEEGNFYSDIKESIEKHFGFLKEFGFKNFKAKQVAYEFHFKTKNKHVLIDIWFEAIPETPIWAKINGYSIDNLELKNTKLKDYTTQLKANYKGLFHQFLETKDNEFLTKITQQYALYGREINDRYIEELSEILKRHTSVLSGDFELLKSNSEILIKRRESKVAADRIKKGIYTLQYQFFSTDDYDGYEEFTELKDIKQYLSEKDEIKKYRILDCHMNEINLENGQ